jgi:hypothetical protein
MKLLRRSPAPTSLRLRLVLGLSLTLCVLWGSVAAWMFPTMQRELRTMLDDRLIASARMVSGIVHQFQPAQVDAITPANNALLSVIARDGVACEVSLVRSEVDILPLARPATAPTSPRSPAPALAALKKAVNPGAPMCWRKTASALPPPTGWTCANSWCNLCLYPGGALCAGPGRRGAADLVDLHPGSGAAAPPGEELQHRPPQDPSPVQTGQDTAELAPLVAA